MHTCSHADIGCLDLQIREIVAKAEDITISVLRLPGLSKARGWGQTTIYLSVNEMRRAWDMFLATQEKRIS